MTGPLLRFVLAAVVAAGSLAALGALSYVPYTAEPLDDAVIRLAWRARGEPVRECRRRGADELAKLPPHMRQEEVCERRIAPYRLHLLVDGAPVVDEVVRAGGVREDRPLFVFHELRVSPGTHTIRLTFERQGAVETEVRRPRTETPPRLVLERSVTLPPRRIVLVTYDDERKRLHLVGGT